MKNVITFDFFFCQYKDSLPINRINDKLNHLIVNRRIIILNENTLTNVNTNKFDEKLQFTGEFVSKAFENCHFSFIIDHKMLQMNLVDKFALIYYLQKFNIAFEIFGIITSKGFKIRIWKSSKISLEEILEEIQSYKAIDIELILKNEYFIIKSDFKEFEKRKK